MARNPEPGSMVERLDEERVLLERVRAGDEEAFAELAGRLSGTMLRSARLYTRDDAAIEDALQDTWIAVLRGLDSFEGRSSVRTWVLGVLLNQLRARLRSEARLIPFSQLADPAADPAEPALPPEPFLPASHPRGPHHWAERLAEWGENPQERLCSAEARALLAAAIAGLPPAQREVVTLRDVEGWSAAEVCELLGITAVNQRVLLHRARSRLRRALEPYFAEVGA